MRPLEERRKTARMEDFGRWEFSLENELLITDFCSKLKSENTGTVSSNWWDLCKNESSPDIEMVTNSHELNDEEFYIVHLIYEALETNSGLEETVFAGVPFNSLFKIFHKVSNELDDFKFSSFCELIASWNNDILIEQSLQAIVLPKLKETEESSACIIYALTELAKQKPSQVCHYVMSPLLEDFSQFSDFELLSKVYEVLPTPQKNFIILTVTSKSDIKEHDWMMLQPLVKNLSPSSFNIVIESIQKWSYKFTKSEVFGKFLVILCKNLTLMDLKEILIEAVQKHDTIFKRQALKILQLK